MEVLVYTEVLVEKNPKKKKTSQRDLLTPLIALFLACFIGFLIYTVDQDGAPTDVPQRVVYAEDFTNLDVTLLATFTDEALTI